MSDRHGSWICTYTGKQFYPLDPRPGDFELEDIGHALAHLCRFTGHCRQFYSVGEHSCRVAFAVHAAMKPGRDRVIAEAWAIMHDAAEAYTNDVSRPVKRMDQFKTFRDIETRIENAIAEQFGLPILMPGIVKEMDEVLLVTEARDLMNGFDERWHHWEMRDKALTPKIVPWQPWDAKATFIKLANDNLSRLKQSNAERKGAVSL